MTSAITGVAPDLVVLCLSLPRSLGLGEAGSPARVDLTCTLHFVPDGNSAFKSAAPLLPGLTSTVAPLPLNERATFSS